MNNLRPKWYVMDEYNDDKNPYMQFESLAQVKKYLHTRSLTLVHPGHYQFRSGSKRIFHVFSKAGMIRYLGNEQKVLEDFQYFGFVDEPQRHDDYFKLIETWEPSVTQMKGYENEGPLAKHLLKTMKNPMLMDENNILWNTFKKHLERHEKVFAPRFPKSLGEVQ